MVDERIDSREDPAASRLRHQPGPSIHLALTDDQIESCFPVMHQLRPQIDPADFVGLVRAQHAEGYHLAALEIAGSVVAVAGFRMQLFLATGRTLYVDDLVTDARVRSQGHGEAMIRWLIDFARQARCKSFSLDSGTQRQDAHAFYLRNRLRITSFHFHLAL